MNLFFQKLRIRKNSLLAGFFVMTTILVGLFWFGNNFLIQKDDFLDIIPVDTTIYWHFSGSDEQKKEWFFLKTKEILKEEASLTADLLFKESLLKTNNISLAIFPSLQEFVYYTEFVDVLKIEEARAKIEKEGLFMLDLGDNKLAVTNNKIILSEISNIKKKEMPSLFANFALKMAMNKASKESMGQIYLRNNDNLKIGNLSLFFGISSITEENNLYIRPIKTEGEAFNYEYSLISSGFFLTANTIETVKSTLAFIFPEIVARRLPDGTRVREIIANSDIFNFEEVDDILFMKIKAVKRDLWLKDRGEKVFLSTNRENLTNFLEEKEALDGDYGKNMFDFYFWVVKKMKFSFDGAVFGVN
ncbi:hypothetical protein A2555_00655 [Candidatus Falkowbacteria bacterium RIFOXYD2_FULL_39_16]|nr:MAG: hypothetical protein A2555_00655 [Candidatus Falkowbacteria bacterium RIFOXYD2_FULL_39_16]